LRNAGRALVAFIRGLVGKTVQIGAFYSAGALGTALEAHLLGTSGSSKRGSNYQVAPQGDKKMCVEFVAYLCSVHKTS
jgi:hypothetical protein